MFWCVFGFFGSQHQVVWWCVPRRALLLHAGLFWRNRMDQWGDGCHPQLLGRCCSLDEAKVRLRMQFSPWKQPRWGNGRPNLAHSLGMWFLQLFFPAHIVRWLVSSTLIVAGRVLNQRMGALTQSRLEQNGRKFDDQHADLSEAAK